MFAYQPPLNPPANDWIERILPERCKARIEYICNDILKRGEDTNFSKIYDALYQMVQEDVENEQMEDWYDGTI